jgi:F-type H+-transporting ATPase subunit delta
MTSSAVTSRYAGALVEVVTGKTSPVDPQQTVQELRSFEGVFDEFAELRNVLASPAVPVNRKRAVVSGIADRLGSSRITRNFLFVLIDHRRLEALGDIVDHFEIQLDERLGYLRAEVTSAVPLNDGQRLSIEERLSKATGKQLRVKYAVDESLIGGVVARVGSTVYDGSVRGQLRAMERRLAAE